MKPGTKIKKGKILFEKIEAKAVKPILVPTELDISAFHMRVGKVLEVQDFKEAEKPLYKLKVDFGYQGIKWTAAGLKNQIKKQSLKGKKIIGLLNLVPKSIAGFKSEFLTLAGVDDKGHIEVLTAEKSKPGAMVYIEGETPKPVKHVTIADFLKLGLKPSKEGYILHYKKPLRTDKEKIKLAVIRHGIIR